MSVMLVAALLATAAAEEPVCNRTGLPAAVAGYARQTGAMNVRRVAAMYASDGVLIGPNGTPYSGPAEIERFLGAAGAAKLVDYVMTVAATTRDGAVWRTEGTYSQRASDPSGTAVSTNGSFSADWRCTRAGWRVARMKTIAG